ncbi:hypothetical protein GUA87_05365 [Sneathiella sp. P13V-1]|uniref:hypothetical protein n=1 Tax=Sneathiella sp. P13V-1 TaxID=2697366 RepID=UPI00187B74E6|nr:hypothetical protein [Sneathiella sp. P13V-1]MBE7636263.1 hypothetical protein [Sneathiella sp. P13V-1]
MLNLATLRQLAAPNVISDNPVITGSIVPDPERLNETAENSIKERLLLPLGIENQQYRNPSEALLKSVEAINIHCSQRLYRTLNWQHESEGDKTHFTIETDLPSLVIRLLKTLLVIARGRSDEETQIGNVLKALDKLLERMWGDSGNLNFIEVAKNMGIPYRPLNEFSVVLEFGYGKNRQFLNRTLSNLVGVLSDKLTSNKFHTHQILKSAGLPASESLAVTDARAIPLIIENLGFPLALKPLDGMRGNGVVLDIQTEEELRAAFKISSSDGGGVIAEKYCNGEDHRLMVLGGKCRYAVSRKRPSVVGDGKHSIEQLMDIENRSNPNRLGLSYTLLQLKKSAAKDRQLASMGLDYTYIPRPGEKVVLHPIPNLQEGGDCENVLAKIHPANLQLAEDACRALDMKIAGVDFVSPDCSQPYWENGAIIVEINSMPSFRPVCAPDPSRHTEIVSEFLKTILPEPETSSVSVSIFIGEGAEELMETAAKKAEEKGCRALTSTKHQNRLGASVLVTPTIRVERIEQALFNPAADQILIQDSLKDIANEGLGYRFIHQVVLSEIPTERVEQQALHLLLQNTTDSIQLPRKNPSFVKYLKKEFPKLKIVEILQ